MLWVEASAETAKEREKVDIFSIGQNFEGSICYCDASRTYVAYYHNTRDTWWTEVGSVAPVHLRCEAEMRARVAIAEHAQIHGIVID